jgi:Cu+-exporting ATPase
MCTAAGRTTFCSGRCREKFAADPAKYLDPAARAAEPVPAGTIYTCPMHPEIRQVGPGSCPICGMALEQELLTAAVPSGLILRAIFGDRSSSARMAPPVCSRAAIREPGRQHQHRDDRRARAGRR